MLGQIRTSLGRLIAEYGELSRAEVDVRHEPPIREWIERLTRPTINFYLFDLHENVNLRGPGMQMVRGAGEAVRRVPPRRIDLHFMVSALTTELEDEDALIWRLLSTLLKYPEWPEEIVPAAARELSLPVTARLEHEQEAARLADLWGGLAARPRPALWYVVTVPLDLDVAIATPLVLTRVARTIDRDTGREMKRSLAITGTVRLEDGTPLADVTIALEDRAAELVTTSQDGHFALHNLAEGPLRLRVTTADGRRQAVTLQIPADSYDITIG